MEFYVIAIAILGGFLAGVINTLAGNGSAITLSILTELIGLPGNVANGTNRVGVLAQGVSSTFSFVRRGKIKLDESRTLVIFTILGAIIGVWCAVNVTDDQFRSVFKYLLVVMLVVTVINPKKWLHDYEEVRRFHPLIAIPIYLALGFYGGFIQMGMGVIFLIVTVLLMKYKIIEANAIKTIVVFAYTILVVVVFQLKGLIQWEIGLIIAVGQLAGGYVAAEFGSLYREADLWAYRLLILVIITAILSLFDIF